MVSDSVNVIPHPISATARESAPPELPLLRFRLRHLLGCVVVVCVLMAGLVAADGTTSLVILLAVLVVAAHVAGTTLGSRLRTHADRQRTWEAIHAPHNTGSTFLPLGRAPAPGEQPLYGRHSPRRRLPLLVAAGALVGLLTGTVLLATTIGHRSSAAGIAVGAVSLGVVGGWFALLGGSFWAILRQGWREAIAHQKQDEARRLSTR